MRQDGEGRTARNGHTHAMPIRAHKTQLHHRQRPKVVANRQVFALGIPHTYDCRTFGGIHQNDVRRPDSKILVISSCFLCSRVGDSIDGIRVEHQEERVREVLLNEMNS